MSYGKEIVLIFLDVVSCMRVIFCTFVQERKRVVKEGFNEIR